MSDEGTEYSPIGFSFALQIAGVALANDAAFQEVSGLAAEMRTEEVAEGGENRFKHKVPTGAKYSTLVLKRGIVAADSPLIPWCKGAFDLLGMSEPIKPKDIIVTLMNENGSPVATWSFNIVWPLTIKMADLSPHEGCIAVEMLELSYNSYSIHRHDQSE